MACERYLEAVTELAAGGPAVAGLKAHLAECADCREELAALRRVLEAVDAELRPFASSEPSPALAARIRQAASEPEARSGSRPAFALQALAAAAVLAAVAFVLLLGRAPTPTSVAALTPRPETSGTPLPASVALPAATARPAASPRPREERVPATAAARRAASPEPEVVVPPGQMEALVRFAALVNRVRVAPPMLGATGQPSPELAELRLIDIGPISVGSIDIQPLEIVPLDPAETSGT
jgi:hypothetical protein